MMVGRMETLVPMGKGLGSEEGLDGPKTDSIPGGEVEERLNELRDSMVVVTDTPGDKLQTLEDMVLAVSTMAEEAVAKLAKDVEGQKADRWSG